MSSDRPFAVPPTDRSVIAGARAAERGVVLSYLPESPRVGFAALLALDDMLARSVRTTREAIVGQMRLTWWYEALIALDTARAPAEPVLRELSSAVMPCGVTGAALADMIDGWERLLDPEPLDAVAMAAYATARGGALFAAAAAVCATDAAMPRIAGEGWALADLAGHLGDADDAARARAMAGARFETAFRARWPRPARALGALALLARFDIMASPPPAAGPRRVLRLMRHRWNGT